MPKAPILSSTRFFETLQNGLSRDLDWQMVQTTLGVMLEPVPVLFDSVNLQTRDLYDCGYTERLVNPGGPLFSLTSGDQWLGALNKQ